MRALIERINKKTEYSDVAYLIAFALFEIGQLNRVFTPALKKLYGDRANGYSDLLRILDILLAFRYDDFDEKSLEQIEKFVFAKKEHTFQIKERINAIRVRKMLATPTTR